MSSNEILSVWVGKSNIRIVAIASKMIQFADFTDIIFFSSQLSGLCIKSDFVHEIIDPSSLNILRGSCAFLKDNICSKGAFLKEFIKRRLKYICCYI